MNYHVYACHVAKPIEGSPFNSYELAKQKAVEISLEDPQTDYYIATGYFSNCYTRIILIIHEGKCFTLQSLLKRIFPTLIEQ